MQSITKFTIEGKNNESNILERESTVDLGISSPKSALLLNFLFNRLNADRPTHTKWSRRYGNETVKSGGGLLVRAEARVMIDDFSRITIYFDRQYDVEKYIRVAEGKAAVRKAILDKIANELKKAWKNYSVADKIQILYKFPASKRDVYGVLNTSNWEKTDYLDLKGIQTIKDERDREFVEVSLNEYRALYEFLKGRNPEKNKERNGITAWDSMIGKQIEDQFLINAVENIKNEIAKAKETYTQQCYEAQNERDTAKSLADKICREKIDGYQNEMKNKIEELKGQMAEAVKMAEAVTAPSPSF